ncbi:MULTISPECIES: Stk1 family PASTA domain-containing Ser/Thr kinase [Thermoanaerobacterium]|uniref:non-specific serine/threonine protein kinase n=2 Tax=Thermoanaerobacterium TaxID=28895 RepID=W9EFK4_9THEO|nr:MULTISPECIES: Stk1 family PASTA domain-containing Ser/Thr kinase [Thermoanaerobacterium]AFK86732.1 serine/threonine protein kinase with PASTA sensor(s) [Thermoanaerobacterium saccharolyticum JW/SL-YS485]ETO38509.1 serine/threonine protein kinase with PASTA sensor(s) [Thermoanaerobacterium aotearoense SCUT27]
MIGKMLGNRYEILEKIGEGGMAKVYKAKCHLLNRIVAIKVLRSEFVSDEEFVRRFKRESQAAASLSHPNIVSIYDVGQEGDIYYIVMEYVNGKTLKQLIKETNGPLPIPKSLDIARQVCRALEHAHKHHIVHRDIKPQNILVTDDNIVKVTDFGIARAANGSTITYGGGDVLGTAYYFSPEQAKGSLIDEKTDIYSLGIVMYEMLTGKVPFEGESPISVALKHIQENIVPPSKLNPRVPYKLDKIVLKATEKDINYRYKSAAELLNDIDTFISDPDKLIIGDLTDNNVTRVMKAEEINEKIKDSKTPNKRKGRKILRNIGIAILILALMASLSYGTMYFLNNMATAAEVKVPDIKGQTLDKATTILENSNLKLNISDSQYSDAPTNTILSQDPPAGETVKKGSTVNVVVSKGKQNSVVPNVIGSEYRDAQLKLKNSGLNANLIWDYNDNYPNGYVYDQNPRQGVQVEYNTVVDVYVSKGPEMVTVPNVQNMSLDDATKALEDVGLKVGNVTTQFSDSVPNNFVISQSIPQGTSIQKGKSIDLIVSQSTQTQQQQQQTQTQLPQGYKTKEITIDLPNQEGPMKVDVYVIQDGNKTLQYSNTYTYADSPITVPVSGKGNVVIEVDINGNVYETMGAKF